MMPLHRWRALALSLSALPGPSCGGGGEDTTSTSVELGPESPVPHDPGSSSCHGEAAGDAARRNLETWHSEDGTTFTPSGTFQYCADVPSVAQHADGTIITAFQGFFDPEDEIGWDRVHTRSSTDEGRSWSLPEPIVISGAPAQSGRPFDPTITYDAVHARWRLYFSMSSSGSMQLDESVCTHSAHSTDGLHYTYEEGTRYCASDGAVIDPAVVLDRGTWTYIAPRGAPQEGAHFATSADGLEFTPGTPIASDMNHNWTGNLVAHDGGLRFFGVETNVSTGNHLWWSESADGGTTWSDYQVTNIPAGKDPGVLRQRDGSWLMHVPTDG